MPEKSKGRLHCLEKCFTQRYCEFLKKVILKDTVFQANQNAVSFLNIPAKAHFCFSFFTEIFVLDALQVSKTR